MKAAIYSRYSTDRQTESSIADQVRVCEDFATREGMTVVARFADEAISGAAFGNRPGFLEMRAAAMAGTFNVLLVADTTRLSRSQELAPLIDQLRFQGVRVFGVQDAFDSDTSHADLMAGVSGILSVEFRRMIRTRTHSALESRAKARRSAGGKCYGYRSEPVDPCDENSQRRLVKDEAQVAIVRQIFARFIEGNSCRSIARELNEQGVPSPGSTWKRAARRSRGWMDSGIRALLKNERYTGRIIWNRSQWIKDPNTGKRKRLERPKSEWHVYHDEDLRIISDSTFEKARQRTADASKADRRLKSGGKPRYLLSGLLRCDQCGSNYILSSASRYSCSGYLGGSCTNSVGIRREKVEDVILGPIRDELLSPERVKRMAEEMKQLFQARLREQAERAEALPAELHAIDDRIGRMHERLAAGDPDLEADELQAAIDRAEGKRRELLDAQPAAKRSARMTALLPQAAAEYRKQIAKGLDQDPRAAGKARALLRRLLGTIRLCPGPDKSLWAEFEIYPAALLQRAGAAGVGTAGSGGRI